MPYRTFRCLVCSTTLEELQDLHEDTSPSCCAKPMDRDYELENSRCKTSTVTHRFSKPIEMLSVAVNNESEIREFQERNPNIEISKDRSSPNFGVPIVHSRQEKLQVLNNEGFQERN